MIIHKNPFRNDAGSVCKPKKSWLGLQTGSVCKPKKTWLSCLQTKKIVAHLDIVKKNRGSVCKKKNRVARSVKKTNRGSVRFRPYLVKMKAVINIYNKGTSE